MTVCNKCGRKFKKSMPLPIRCFCNGESVNIIESEIKQKSSSTLPEYLEYLKDQGRKHWDKLHKYALIEVWDIDKANYFFLDWQNNIPNINCSCRKYWLEMVKEEEYKPDFSSRENYFKWTVKVHNKVNEKLEKPTVSYEEACEIHGFGV